MHTLAATCALCIQLFTGFPSLFFVNDPPIRPPSQSFTELQHRPQLVDLTVEEGQRLKVIYGSSVGFHVIDVDSGNPYDIYIPSHVSATSASPDHPHLSQSGQSGRPLINQPGVRRQCDVVWYCVFVCVYASVCVRAAVIIDSFLTNELVG